MYEAVASSESEHFYQPPDDSDTGVMPTIIAVVVSLGLLVLVAVIVVHRCRVARRRQVAILRIVHGPGQNNFALLPNYDRRVPQVFKEQYVFNSLLMPPRIKPSKYTLDDVPLAHEVRICSVHNAQSLLRRHANLTAFLTV